MKSYNFIKLFLILVCFCYASSLFAQAGGVTQASFDSKIDVKVYKMVVTELFVDGTSKYGNTIEDYDDDYYMVIYNDNYPAFLESAHFISSKSIKLNSSPLTYVFKRSSANYKDEIEHYTGTLVVYDADSVVTSIKVKEEPGEESIYKYTRLHEIPSFLLDSIKNSNYTGTMFSIGRGAAKEYFSAEQSFDGTVALASSSREFNELYENYEMIMFGINARKIADVSIIEELKTDMETAMAKVYENSLKLTYELKPRESYELYSSGIKMPNKYSYLMFDGYIKTIKEMFAELLAKNEKLQKAKGGKK